MTTELKQDTRHGVSPLLGAAVVGFLVVLLLAGGGWFAAQSAGWWGALTGGSLAVVVLLTSTTVVNVAAGSMPDASVFIALLTFFLQVVLLGVIAAALHDSAAMGKLSPEWFAGGLILATMTWLAVHAWLYTRLRIPAYDLQPAGRPGSES